MYLIQRISTPLINASYCLSPLSVFATADKFTCFIIQTDSMYCHLCLILVHYICMCLYSLNCAQRLTRVVISFLIKVICHKGYAVWFLESEGLVWKRQMVDEPRQDGSVLHVNCEGVLIVNVCESRICRVWCLLLSHQINPNYCIHTT
jgi:hypothetical protein